MRLSTREAFAAPAAPSFTAIVTLSACGSPPADHGETVRKALRPAVDDVLSVDLKTNGGERALRQSRLETIADAQYNNGDVAGVQEAIRRSLHGPKPDPPKSPPRGQRGVKLRPVMRGVKEDS